MRMPTALSASLLAIASAAAVPALLASLAACTSFTNVRSADVRPGNLIGAQISYATSPGDAAGWQFGNNFDCAENCGGGILGGELGYARGFVPDSSRPFTLGVGLGGILPYAEGYVQLDRSSHPYGVGLRIAAPLAGFSRAQLYGRYDIPLQPGRLLLWNPGILYSSITNVSSDASFLGLVNGFGMELRDGGNTFTPSLAIVVARARHGRGYFAEGPTLSGFVTAGLSVSVGR